MKNVQKRPRIKWFGTILTAALCAVFALVLACNLTIVIKGALNPQRPPSVFGVTPLVVLSGSMSGTQPGHVETGDLVLVRNVDPSSLAVGDVIAFMSGGTAITHRIVRIDLDEEAGVRFTTKGDANNAEDAETVAPDQLLGVYWARLPAFGEFVLFMQKPLGMTLVVGVPVLAIIFYDMVRRRRCARAEQQKNRELEAELARLRALAGEDGGACTPHE